MNVKVKIDGQEDKAVSFEGIQARRIEICLPEMLSCVQEGLPGFSVCALLIRALGKVSPLSRHVAIIT